jgi:predicted metal-dependent phosphoesterase TrpH
LGYKDLARIDLHIHSNASDGTLSPSEIISRACHLNLRAISITDHDTLEGSRVAFHAGIPSIIKFLSGVEISAAPPPSFFLSGSFHILGYGIRLEDPTLDKALKRLQIARKNRNPQIIDHLKKLGIDISLKDLQEEFGESQLGRPHIAQLMVKKGFVATIDEAFDSYIGKNKPAYVDKHRMSCAEAIETIRGAGGIAVLAHPYLLRTNGNHAFENLLIHLKSLGLGGLEVYYPDHPADETVFFVALAKRLDLLMTGGTDFHGNVNPDIEMGRGRGSFFVPYRLYEEIIKCIDHVH